MCWSICLPFAEQSQSVKFEPAEKDNEVTEQDEVANIGDGIEDDDLVEEDQIEDRQNERKFLQPEVTYKSVVVEWIWHLNTYLANYPHCENNRPHMHSPHLIGEGKESNSCHWPA